MHEISKQEKQGDFSNWVIPENVQIIHICNASWNSWGQGRFIGLEFRRHREGFAQFRIPKAMMWGGGIGGFNYGMVWSGLVTLFKHGKSFSKLGHLTALTKSHLIGGHPSKEQTTETMDPSPKTKGLLHYPCQ